VKIEAAFFSSERNLLNLIFYMVLLVYLHRAMYLKIIIFIFLVIQVVNIMKNVIFVERGIDIHLFTI